MYDGLDLWIAVLIDFLIGDPKIIPHPVQAFGFLIAKEEKFIRHFKETEFKYKFFGLFIAIINIGLAFFIPYIILKNLKGAMYHIFNIYILFSSVALGSLRNEALAVKKSLNISLDAGRKRVGYIVGRDTENLSEAEVIKATVETVAENTSDGVIAPLFYAVLFGAPGTFMYKMVNTMDSMLGYKNYKYENLGFFPAIIDDIFNFFPARITAILMWVSSLGFHGLKRAFKVFKRDRLKHSSPNSGNPESMVAGLIGIQLGGERFYGGIKHNAGFIGDKINEIEIKNIDETVSIMIRSELLFMAVISIIYIIRRTL